MRLPPCLVFLVALLLPGFSLPAQCALDSLPTSPGQLASPGSGFPRTGFALASHQGRRFAGGSFATAGGVAATNLAAWTGSTWEAVGTTGHELNLIRAVCHGLPRFVAPGCLGLSLA